MFCKFGWGNPSWSLNCHKHLLLFIAFFVFLLMYFIYRAIKKEGINLFIHIKVFLFVFRKKSGFQEGSYYDREYEAKGRGKSIQLRAAILYGNLPNVWSMAERIRFVLWWHVKKKKTGWRKNLQMNHPLKIKRLF